MADTTETIADISAELRHNSRGLMFYFRNEENGSTHAMGVDYIELADRLDAALKRELTRVDAVIDEAVHGYPPEDINDNSERGDCAKLREALKHIKDRLPHMLQYMRVHWEDASAGGYFDELMLVIDAALAAPPRNCDKYATADEALKAQEQMFNDSNFANGECKLGCPECDNPRVGCKIAWLFAPATEKEGGAK